MGQQQEFEIISTIKLWADWNKGVLIYSLQYFLYHIPNSKIKVYKNTSLSLSYTYDNFSLTPTEKCRLRISVNVVVGLRENEIGGE
jgi:hypothetical protein